MAKQETTFRPSDFSPRTFERWLKQGEPGAKVADQQVKNLTARLLRGHIVLNWVGRVAKQGGQPLTIKLGTWRQASRDAELEVSLANFRLGIGGELDVKKFPEYLSIQTARAIAAALTALARSGRDPRGASKAEVEGRLTVRRAIERYAREHQDHKRQGKAVIANLLRHLGRHLDQPVEQITRDHLKLIIDPFKAEGRWSKAYQVRRDISALLAWVEDEAAPGPDYRSPARRIRMQRPWPKRSHTPSLEDIQRIYEAAGELQVWARPAVGKMVFVRLLLLTGCRKSEIAGLRWNEVNGEKIIIPAARHKMGGATQEARVIPLTDTMRALLGSLLHNGPMVFGTMSGGSFDRIAQAVAKLSGVSGWQFHDFRRALRSHLRTAGVDCDVCERILGHAVGGAEGSYDFADLSGQMRAALELWEQMIASPKVVTMGRRTA